MMTFVAVIHIVIAIALIGLVLVQDSKGGALGIGGGTSSSVLGATGATSLAAQATRIAAIMFAITCVILSVMTSSGSKSVLDSANVKAAAPIEAASVPSTENAPANPSPAADPATNTGSATSTPSAAPAQPTPEKK